MSNFRFIEMNVDVSKILNQLHSRPDDWNYVRDLQGAGVDGDVDPYGFLPLTMALVDPGEDPKNAEKTENTPLYKAHSETRKWLRRQGIMQTSRAAFLAMRCISLNLERSFGSITTNPMKPITVAMSIDLHLYLMYLSPIRTHNATM